MKNFNCFVVFLLVGLPWVSSAQSDPRIDRPVQKCIDESTEEIKSLPKNFSIGHWLGRMIELSEQIQESTGTGGGPSVVAILKMESELDDLILLSENCEFLSDSKVKTALNEMKTIYQEKKEVETYKKDPQNNNSNLFGEEDELETMSLPRAAAKKLKAAAEEVKKILKNK
ncbi:MAG: hypothetical protein NW226_22490 [Microscillaceae bacterium]|nr:hypothetical protein [Microscillaceae bacterium]